MYNHLGDIRRDDSVLKILKMKIRIFKVEDTVVSYYKIKMDQKLVNRIFIN